MTEARPYQAPEPEPERVSGMKASAVIAVSLATGVIAVAISGWLLGAARAAGGPEAPARGGEEPIAPRANGRLEQTLIEHAASGYRDRNVKLDELDRYEWVDRAHGVYAIPIDRAIDIVVERGGAR